MNRRTFLSYPAAAATTVGLANTIAGLANAATLAPDPAPIDFKSHLPAPGSFPEKWICGSPSCMDNTDPPVHVHWYNAHTAILRQNKAYSYEAPFAPLYFGNDRILLLDEGFVQLRTDWDFRGVVDKCIDEWCARNGRDPASMELLVAFTHLHSDHYAATNQFADRPNTRYMGLTQEEMFGFWGMTNFPEQQVALDLGGREILIWGSPGHVIAEFAYYDSYTQILFTGDMFYRGRCYISFWQPWFDSMTRLIRFCDTHPVSHVMGCHVEMSKDGQDYAYGMTYQPDEAPVQMTVEQLRSSYEFAKTITKPGIYYTGTVFLCNQTRGTTTIDRNPYRYD
ncbi:glyoxylase-like metal-dependent hydrolase (beta-lactamase superfamily II) [Sphingomonas vulcanisoli]|uniref:Glyoxylase-like metal-dependent hydrolase (Beta-lactamase superfamily II) n=1 Tax=Sphingomonas vulcanisoli TaxID=1658060 RepID=A0ABX0TR65_9SPHN|nr:MBL fold metallo-hydrolase [Sphingomonas vulcanisoli]NIJ06660.1 glyoxylase-like metal-dependent hydrolase (beta-lactamase superfamily II) [Sphingomonas vulcanisoli]